MMQAAKQAGFNNISVGSEAESLLAVFLANNESTFTVDNAIIACDAGGGTVDLATVIIQNLDSLVVDEACVSEGVLCGGIYLDRNARNMFRRKLRRQNLPDFELLLDCLMKEFDHKFKKRFNGTQEANFSVPGLEEDIDRGFRHGRLLISGVEIRELVFDPIIEQTEARILWQINQSQDNVPSIKITTVALGGGLGASDYIFDCLQRTVDKVDSLDNVSVQQLANPGGANVAKGLILLASQQSLVKQRKCRQYYGLYTILTYDKKIHGTEAIQPKIDDYYGTEPIIKTVDWLLCKGQPIDENFVVRRPGRTIGVHPNAIEIEELFFICDENLVDDMADRKYTLQSEVPTEKVKYISKISKSENFAERFTPDGERWFEVKFDFILRHLDGDQISCTIAVISKTGEKLIIPHQPLMLNLSATDTTETETRCLGSLVSRWKKGPHIPQSAYARRSMFPGLRRKHIENYESDAQLPKARRLEKGTIAGD